VLCHPQSKEVLSHVQNGEELTRKRRIKMEKMYNDEKDHTEKDNHEKQEWSQSRRNGEMG